MSSICFNRLTHRVSWAEDTTEIGQYKDYYYPNAQAARTLWYHDHAIEHTAENAYFGQAGFYLLTDPIEQALNLPKGKYEVALALSSKRYNVWLSPLIYLTSWLTLSPAV
jgi:hypothetical protein